MRATSLAAVMLCALFLPLYAIPSVDCTQSPYFGNGQQELTISFPPGGGQNATVNLSLPAGSTVLSATMSITGLPLVSRGSIDYSTPDTLKSVPSSLNLSFDEQGARLAPFNWSWLQSSDADFSTDEAQNITVSDGARISAAVVGGVSHPFTAATGINPTGMPSVSCTPDGEILVAWIQWNQSFPGWWDACFQRFDASGVPIGPQIARNTGRSFNQSEPRAISDQSGRTVFLWDSTDWEDVRAAVFDRSGNQIGYEYSVGYGEYGSAVVTGPDEMLASFTPYEPYNLLRGQWLHLDGTPTSDSFVLEKETTGYEFVDPMPSGIVSVGGDGSIAHASTFMNATDGHLRAHVLRTDSAGGPLHGAVLIGANDSYVTPTSFAILDDGMTNVAYTADYLYRNLSVRCARVAANGTIIADFSLSGTDGEFFAPSLCRLPGDRFACAWASALSGDDAMLEGRVFKADGTPEGDIFQLGQARGANASWELCARGNSSLALVVRSDAPAPYGSVRVEVVDLQRALKGHIDSKVLDRPGTVQAAVQLASGTSYSVDVLDAATRNVTHANLHNGDPVSSWAPYILRLNLQRGSFNSSEAAPVARLFGVATMARDYFYDTGMVSSTENVTVGNGHANLTQAAPGGELVSTQIELPYVVSSYDQLSWNRGDIWNEIGGNSLRVRVSGVWTDWVAVESYWPIQRPRGDAIQWNISLGGQPGRFSIDTLGLNYSLWHNSGFLLSAPANLTDGAFTGYRVNWTTDGTARALVTTDGGMTYDSASNGLWKSASGGGHALRAMMVLEGTGNSSPVLSGFRVDYESQSRPSDIELEIGGSYRWSPPDGSSLENGVEVRDFSRALNDVLARSGGPGNVTIPLNFTSQTSGLLKLSGLKMVINLPPVIESASPSTDPVLEQSAIQRFELDASDPDGDPLTINWTLDGQFVGNGASLELTTPDAAGNYTLVATVSDGRASISHVWNLTIIFVDHDRPPEILERFPAQDPVMNETESVSFSVRASDPEGQPLRYAWYLDGEKVSVSDNFTYRTWYDFSGPHIVSVRVGDGSLNVSTQWNVTVLDRDRPPIIRDWDPAADLSAPAGRLLQFQINASDPDGDALTFTWYVDGILVDGASSTAFSFTANWSDGRLHTVKAVASDSQLNASHVWQVRSIIPGTDNNPNPSPPNGVAIDRPWGLAIAIIIIVAILGTVVALYLWKKRE